ncbi:hypothetical protein BDZ89DRAFT_1120406 [Hymenopellis radicata]|nr:hypothetical protein BDZ89DRAFT_1120406 [Hymenopellis radicata]
MSQPAPDAPATADSARHELIVQMCTYIFGLVTSYLSTSVSLFVIIAFIAVVHLCLLPKIWPGNTLSLAKEPFELDQCAFSTNTVTCGAFGKHIGTSAWRTAFPKDRDAVCEMSKPS